MMKEQQKQRSAKDFELTALYMSNQYMMDNKKVEQTVIGEMLSREECQPEIFAKVSPPMFTDEDCRLVFKTAEAMYRQGKAIDLLTVHEAVRAEITPEDAGIMAYKMGCYMEGKYSCCYVSDHILILQEYYTRRLGFTLLGNMIEKMQVLTDSPFDVLAETIDLCTRLLAATDCMEKLKDMPKVMEIVFEALRRRMEQHADGLTGIDMGIPTMNELLLGWQPGYLYIIAALTGEGKTALMLHSALVAAHRGKHVLIISMEMSAMHLGDRLMGISTDIPTEDWAKANLTPEQMEEAEDARKNLEKKNIKLHDTGAITMQEVMMLAKSLHSQKACDIVFIDYLQLFRGGLQRGELREQEVAQNSRMAKQLAMQLNIPVILLSQFNREVYGQKEQRPMLSNLRESGSIEQDADVVMLLHRPASADITTDKRTGYPTEGLLINIVAKNRNGQTKDLYLAHNPAMTHFADYEPPQEWIKHLTGGKERSRYELFMERKKEKEIIR
ncbi:replicative DNA helicase [Phocaeicola sp.]